MADSAEFANAPLRTNYVAILVAAIAYYVIEAVWFKVLGDAWLTALGTNLSEMLAKISDRPTWPLYVGAFICNLIIALVMAWVFSQARVRTAIAGIQWGVMLWLGFVATVVFTNYSFELRHPRLMLIDAGYPLLGLIVAGAIIGGWQKKSS